jgi:hypothetical protein
MTPRRTTLAAACTLTAALALTLAAVPPAGASTVLTTNGPASIVSAVLQVPMTAACDGGGTGTLAVAAVENLTVGAGTTSLPCDGTQYVVTVPVPASVGAWASHGTVTITAALLDASNVTVATLPPTGIGVY